MNSGDGHRYSEHSTIGYIFLVCSSHLLKKCLLLELNLSILSLQVHAQGILCDRDLWYKHRVSICLILTTLPLTLFDGQNWIMWELRKWISNLRIKMLGIQLSWKFEIRCLLVKSIYFNEKYYIGRRIR